MQGWVMLATLELHPLKCFNQTERVFSPLPRAHITVWLLTLVISYAATENSPWYPHGYRIQYIRGEFRISAHQITGGGTALNWRASNFEVGSVMCEIVNHEICEIVMDER